MSKNSLESVLKNLLFTPKVLILDEKTRVFLTYQIIRISDLFEANTIYFTILNVEVR